MRVAFAVWKGRISPVFDVSRQILILSVENGSIAGTHCETFANDDPVYRASRLAELDISTLICGAVSRPLADMLAAQGIQTIPFTAGETDAVIAAYLADALPNPGMSMPGCGTRRRHCRQNLSEKYNILHREQRGGGRMPNTDGTGPGKGSGQGKGGCGTGKQGCGGKGGQTQGPGCGSGQGRKQGQGPGCGGQQGQKGSGGAGNSAGQ
jgi:predicted Fe-Mo cluster-binding NifX family protein